MNVARRCLQQTATGAKKATTSTPRGYATRPAQKPLPRPRDPLSTSTRAVISELSPELTFIHRPPPSAPSPHSLTTAPSSPLLTTPSSSAPLPPVLGKGPPEKKYHLTEEDIEEMRALRASDPITYSAHTLARKFDCTPAFVLINAPLNKQVRREIEKAHLRKQERWSERKKLVREIRAKRREFW